jgi:peptide chain release factor 1
MEDIHTIQNNIKTYSEELQKIESTLSHIDISKEGEKIKKLSQKASQIRKKLDLYKKLEHLVIQLQETIDLQRKNKDAELAELAQEEVESLQKKIELLKEKVTHLEQNSSHDDSNECILEIRAGTGGEESTLFAADLFRMYAKYADSHVWKTSIIHESRSDSGGYKEIFVQLEGKSAYSKLKYENGVHRVQRVPVTESSGRIHTSAVSVVVYPLHKEVDIDIDPSDLRIDVYRSSGPGGQSVNTTDSAVRITHVPTGLVVSCQDEKSQHKNKKKALSILKSRLYDMNLEKQQEEISDIRKTAIKTGDRSAKIRTYNFPQNRVTDHRIKKSWHNLKTILEGNLDDIINSLESFRPE